MMHMIQRGKCKEVLVFCFLFGEKRSSLLQKKNRALAFWGKKCSVDFRSRSWEIGEGTHQYI